MNKLMCEREKHFGSVVSMIGFLKVSRRVFLVNHIASPNPKTIIIPWTVTLLAVRCQPNFLTILFGHQKLKVSLTIKLLAMVLM